MAFTTAFFGETIDAAGGLVNIAALADQSLTTSGDDLTIPTLNQIALIAAGVSSGGDGYARFETPSLLRVTRLYVSPINGNADADAEPGTPPALYDYRRNPLSLVTGELGQAFVESNTGSAAFQWLGLWLSDGAIQPVVGEMFTNRFTNTDTLTVDAWTNGQITPQDRLPAGRYSVVGMRYVGAGAVAARLVFPGQIGYRPGVLGCDSDSDIDGTIRIGAMGSLGEFPHNELPSVDFLSISGDSAQDIYLDLIKIA